MKTFIKFISSKEGKLKLLILSTSLLLLLLTISVAALELTSTPEFCRSCHEMQPEYVTWKASAHSQIRCVDCHIEPGIPALLQHKAASFSQLYKHFTGTVYAPIISDKPIADIVCERCHTLNRIATPSGDIKIPHDAHKLNSVDCVKCHQAVAHAKVAAGFTNDGNWDKWIEPVGKAYMKADFLKFSMQECLTCHREEDVGPSERDCDACHRKLVKPQSHLEPLFESRHGTQARQNLKLCDTCHRISLKPGESKLFQDNPVAGYARRNTFCTGCHLNTKNPPPSHTISWKRNHALEASDDRFGCLVCHDEGKPAENSAAVKTFCYRCHQTKIHYEVLVLGQHRNGPTVNATVEPVQNPCLNCHSRPSCEKCHYIPISTDPLLPGLGPSNRIKRRSYPSSGDAETPIPKPGSPGVEGTSGSNDSNSSDGSDSAFEVQPGTGNPKQNPGSGIDNQNGFRLPPPETG